MFKTSLVNSAALIAFLGATNIAGSQEAPRSGIYQIRSGLYHMEGGIAGGLISVLPDPSLSFVSLVIGSGPGPAELTFLDSSWQLAFPRLTNGTVSGNSIQFHYETGNPFDPLLPAWVEYVVTNSAGHLWISGSITSAPACCDIPYFFGNRDVRATYMPVMSIRAGSKVELGWSSSSNQIYQVQYQADLAQLGWTNLGEPVQGNGTTNYMVDSVGPAHPQRFFRVLTLP